MSKVTEPGPEVPVSTMPYPPLHVDKKYVVLSDWLVLFMVRPEILHSFPLDSCSSTQSLTWLFCFVYACPVFM